jgi:TRAP-type mannitol/chloroaromatic compound transport system permease small subunit
MILEGSSEIDGIKGEFLLKTLIPIFALLMIAQGLSISLRAVMHIFQHEKPLLSSNFDNTLINENSRK